MTIAEAVKASGTVALFSKGSIKAAEKMLNPNETLIFAACVNVAVEPVGSKLKVDVASIKDKVNGIFVITSKRVYFCNSVMGSGTSKQIMINDIVSIDDVSTLGLTKLRITGIAEMFVVDGTKSLTDKIQQAINDVRISAQ